MSLRWKLFRFLAIEQLYKNSGDEADTETSLFPSLTADHDEETKARQALLSRFSSAADRSIHADALCGLYIFALPRAVVQFFNLTVIHQSLSFATTDKTRRPPIPLHYTFAAHDASVCAVQLVRGAAHSLPWLVTLGVDDSAPALKIWAFKDQSHTNSPSLPGTYNSVKSAAALFAWRGLNDANRLRCIALFRLHSDVHPNCLAVRDVHKGISSISQLSVGFDDGSVIVLTGDLCRERATRVRIAPAPGEMIEAKPIVFLKYVADWMYCVSEVSVCVIVPTTTDRDKQSRRFYQRHVLDNRGVPRRELCCVIEYSAELIVAKEEALYFFNRDGRGPCLAFPTEGPQSSVFSAGHYLVHSTGQASITAYDVVNKLIAYRGKGIVSKTFHGKTADTRYILLCIFQGPILKLTEISIEERVGMLLKRGLYVSAVALSRIEVADAPHGKKGVLIRALRQYSEYLMSKNRYEEAAEQLVETIGEGVDPSWVITRLVEQSGLRSGLRLYLEALHAAGKATFVHTKVLITCYRHDRARGRILGSRASEKTTDEYVINVFSDIDWTEDQIDAAIMLCRDAGLYKVAERVARKKKRHVQLALTMVEDLNEPQEALQLLRSLPDSEAYEAIQAVARQILVQDPESFVQYLSGAICRSASTMPAGASRPVLRVHDFLPIFIDMPAWQAVLLDRVVKTPGGVVAADAPETWNLLFESLVFVDVKGRLQSKGSAFPAEASSRIPSPHLERTGSSRVSSLVAEDVSRSYTEERMKPGRPPVGRRALKVLQSRRSVIDLRAALEVAELYGHDPCLEYLYEHLRMYRELGVSLRASQNGPQLLRVCRRHGDREAQLWIECIRLHAPLANEEEYGEGEDKNSNDLEESDNATPADIESVTSEESALSRFTRDSAADKASAQEVLDEAILALDRSGVMSPIEILDIVVEACPHGAWGLVREYFDRCVTAQRRDAISAEHNNMLMDTELQELRKETEYLRDETMIIKPKPCAACDDAISVPAVHFYCEHSFHASCLGPGGTGAMGVGTAGVGVEKGSARITDVAVLSGSEVSSEERPGLWGEECPRCAPELDAMVSMRQALQEKNSRQDELFGMLRGSKDGFSAILGLLEQSPFL